MSADGFPYTDAQRRWWFATHGEPTSPQAVAELYSATRKPRTVPEAEKWAKQHLGIDAQYGKGVDVANDINAALMEAQARGAKLPKRVIVTKLAKRVDIGQYRASTDTLEFAAEPFPANTNRPGWLSSDNRYHTIWHELGHAEHARAIAAAGRQWDTINNYQFSAALLPEIRATVSRYGASSAKEFVAEVYAGLMSGKRYSDTVMRIYASLDGVVR